MTGQETAVAQSDRLCPDCGEIIKKGDIYHRRHGRYPLRICMSCYNIRSNKWHDTRERGREAVRAKKDILIDILKDGPKLKNELEEIIGGSIRTILRRLMIDGYNVIEDTRLGTQRNPLISLGKTEKAKSFEIKDQLQTMVIDEFQYLSLKSEIKKVAAQSVVTYILSSCCEINADKNYLSYNDKVYEYEFIIDSEWSNDPNKIELTVYESNLILHMWEGDGLFMIRNFDDVFNILNHDGYGASLFILRSLLREGM